MKKLKHILLEQGILGPNIDIRTGKPIAMATPGRNNSVMLFDPKVAAKQLVAVKSHSKSTIPAEIKNIILAIPDAAAYNTVLIEFKRLLGGMTLPEFIINYGLPADTNGAVNFLNDITRHLTKIKSSKFLISPYNEKIKQLSVAGVGATSAISKIAKQIYDAKGVTYDNEQAAVNAIVSIKDVNTFDRVQQEFKKLSGGVDIATYVTSFIGHIEDADMKGLQIYATGNFAGQRTGPLLDTIIKHLTKIGADKYTIKIFSNLSQKLSGQFITDLTGLPETMHAVNTVASITSMFFGPWGLALSTALQLADAQQYFEEGKDYQGGLALTFALLPGIGKLVGPTLKPFIKKLIAKIVSKSGNFTKLEREVLIRAEMSKDIIRNKINTIIKEGIESGIINPAALPALKFVKSVGNGIYQLTVGAIKHAFVPMVAYDAAYDALKPPMSAAQLNRLIYNEFKATIDEELRLLKLIK